MDISRRTCLKFAAAGALATGTSILGACRPSRRDGDRAAAAMKRATEFMREHCAYRGGRNDTHSLTTDRFLMDCRTTRDTLRSTMTLQRETSGFC